MTAQARYERYWSAEAPSPLTDPFGAPRAELLWRLLPPPPSGRRLRLLDAGAGHGSLVEEANARGLDATGLEISSAAIGRALQSSPQLDLRTQSVEELPWPVEPETFDVAVSFEVIEHLLEPRALVSGAHAALRTGGLFVVSTPYHGVVKNVALALLAFDRHFAVDGDHVRFFTDRALVRLIEEGGFRVESISHLGRVPTLWANTVVVARKA